MEKQIWNIVLVAVTYCHLCYSCLFNGWGSMIEFRKEVRCGAIWFDVETRLECIY